MVAVVAAAAASALGHRQHVRVVCLQLSDLCLEAGRRGAGEVRGGVGGQGGGGRRSLGASAAAAARAVAAGADHGNWVDVLVVAATAFAAGATGAAAGAAARLVHLHVLSRTVAQTVRRSAQSVVQHGLQVLVHSRARLRGVAGSSSSSSSSSSSCCC